MTTPIDFTPTPVALPANVADANALFDNIATVTDANFARINTFLRGDVVKFYRQRQLSVPTSWTLSAWTDFPPADWPTLDVPIPTNVAAVLVFNSVVIVAGTGRYMEQRLRFGGDTTFTEWGTTLTFAYQGTALNETIMMTVPVSQLTPGGNLRLTPQYLLVAVDSTDPTCRVVYGVTTAIVLS